MAKLFLTGLKRAGVTRPALFEQRAARCLIGAHDLRATAITLWLAHRRTEAWVADRTGHRSSIQINGYRRAACTAEELGLPELTPLDLANRSWLAGCLRRSCVTPRISEPQPVTVPLSSRRAESSNDDPD